VTRIEVPREHAGQKRALGQAEHGAGGAHGLAPDVQLHDIVELAGHLYNLLLHVLQHCSFAVQDFLLHLYLP